MRPLLLALAALLFASFPAHAQYKLADAEDVAIAFFKTGGQQPNYETLIRGLPDYRKVPPAKQDAFIAKQKQRLQTAYAKYNPQTDLLTIRTRVNVDLHAKQQDDKDKTVLYSMTLSFGKDDSLFFPYRMGDYHIAIIPKKMDSSFEQNLAPSQYELIKTSLGDVNGPAALYIQLKPSKAYLDEPYKIGGEDQWALVADVAGLVMMDGRGSRLWTYSADWYVSPMTQELRDIYSDKKEERERIMEQENPLKPLE